MPLPSKKLIAETVRRALAEDVGAGDVTSLATIPASTQSTAIMVAREPLTVAGLAVAEEVFRQVSRRIRVRRVAQDGQTLKRGDVLLELKGPAQAILTAERVALNFTQRLSGVATLTAQFVQAIADTSAKILDTRKTTPGLRLLEKYAVTCGGGCNHRIGLYDMVLVKDNHLAALADAVPNPVAAAVQSARRKFPKLKVEVEADTLAQALLAAEAGADFILLDNMTPAQLRTAVKKIGGRAQTEASGGVNLKTVRAIAGSGVNFVSVGALTHSARAVDIALDFELHS